MKATALWLVLFTVVALTLPCAVGQPSASTATQTQNSAPPQQLKVTEYRLPPDKLAKAEALYKTRTVLYLFGLVFGIVVLWILLKLRVAPVFRDLAERVGEVARGVVPDHHPFCGAEAGDVGIVGGDFLAGLHFEHAVAGNRQSFVDVVQDVVAHLVCHASPHLASMASTMRRPSQKPASIMAAKKAHEADLYGLEVTHGLFPNNGEVAASAFQKLGEKSYDYPSANPLLVFWSYSHPPIPDRIRFSLDYDPWDTPEGPKYVK